MTFFIQTSPDVCFHLSFVAPGHGLQDMLLPSFWLEAFFSFSNVFPQEFTVNFPVALGEDVGVNSKKRVATGTACRGKVLQRSSSGRQHPQ